MPYMPEGREEIRAAATVKTADDSRFGLTTMPPFYGDDDLGYTLTGQKRWPQEVVDTLWDIVEDGRELTDQDRYNYLENKEALGVRYEGRELRYRWARVHCVEFVEE